MRCPKCKYIVAEYFQTCPECQEDLSELARYFGPFEPPAPEFWQELWDEILAETAPEGPEAPGEILDDRLLEEKESLLAAAEADEETLGSAEVSEDLMFEALEEEPAEAEEVSFAEEELEAVEELPDIELSAEDLEDSLVEEVGPAEEAEEELDIFEEIEGLEEILPEEMTEKDKET